MHVTSEKGSKKKKDESTKEKERRQKASIKEKKAKQTGKEKKAAPVTPSKGKEKEINFVKLTEYISQ